MSTKEDTSYKRKCRTLTHYKNTFELMAHKRKRKITPGLKAVFYEVECRYCGANDSIAGTSACHLHTCIVCWRRGSKLCSKHTDITSTFNFNLFAFCCAWENNLLILDASQKNTNQTYGKLKVFLSIFSELPFSIRIMLTNTYLRHYTPIDLCNEDSSEEQHLVNIRKYAKDVVPKYDSSESTLWRSSLLKPWRKSNAFLHCTEYQFLIFQQSMRQLCENHTSYKKHKMKNVDTSLFFVDECMLSRSQQPYLYLNIHDNGLFELKSALAPHFGLHWTVPEDLGLYSEHDKCEIHGNLTNIINGFELFGDASKYLELDVSLNKFTNFDMYWFRNMIISAECCIKGMSGGVTYNDIYTNNVTVFTCKLTRKPFANFPYPLSTCLFPVSYLYAFKYPPNAHLAELPLSCH